MQFKIGNYRTTAGFPAVVAQIKPYGMNYVLRGAIECPQTNALAIHSWNWEGLSISAQGTPNAHDFHLVQGEPE